MRFCSSAFFALPLLPKPAAYEGSRGSVGRSIDHRNSPTSDVSQPVDQRFKKQPVWCRFIIPGEALSYKLIRDYSAQGFAFGWSQGSAPDGINDCYQVRPSIGHEPSQRPKLVSVPPRESTGLTHGPILQPDLFLAQVVTTCPTLLSMTTAFSPIYFSFPPSCCTTLLGFRAALSMARADTPTPSREIA